MDGLTMLASDSSMSEAALAVRAGIGSDAVRLLDVSRLSGVSPGAACRLGFLPDAVRAGVGATPLSATARSLQPDVIDQLCGETWWSDSCSGCTATTCMLNVR